MKKTLLLFIAVSSLKVVAFGQLASITNVNLQIHASLDNEPLAWASNTGEIMVNKHSGEFETKLLIDDLRFAITNSNFTGATGENLGKYLILRGVIPINDVLDNNSTVLNLKVELTASFNDIDYPTIFTFSILRIPNQGFSVMMNGSISHTALKIENLKQLDDEMVIAMSFVGF